MKQDQDAARGVPSELRDWLREYRLDRHITTWPTSPPPKGDLLFDPERADVKQYYVRVPVESLADLKAWIGAPNKNPASLEKAGRADATRSGRQSAPIHTGGIDDPTLRAAEQQVLFEDVDERMLGDAFWSGVVRGLLDHWREIPMLVVSSLVVPDDVTVRISNTPTAVFDTVKVYPTGHLRFLNDCKLICRTFEMVAPKPSTTVGDVTTTYTTR
jgi:hypothetical protein